MPSNAIAAIRSAIEREREALLFDVGPFSLEDDEANDEVIMISSLFSGGQEFFQRHRCYLVDDRLVYDDYFPKEEERDASGR